MCPLHVRSAKRVCKKRTRFAERTFAKCPLSEKWPPDADFYSRARKNDMPAQRNVCSKKEHVSLSGHSENVRTAKLTIPCRRKGYHFRDVQKTKNYVKPNTKAVPPPSSTGAAPRWRRPSRAASSPTPPAPPPPLGRRRRRPQQRPPPQGPGGGRRRPS